MPMVEHAKSAEKQIAPWRDWLAKFLIWSGASGAFIYMVTRLAALAYPVTTASILAIPVVDFMLGQGMFYRSLGAAAAGGGLSLWNMAERNKQGQIDKIRQANALRFQAAPPLTV